MRLDAFVLDGHRVDIQPASFERDWMDATPQRFAYRCLPLTIANASGWEVNCPSGFTATWNGGQAMEDIVIEADPGTVAPAVSHFGRGVLTFHVPAVFRTEEGFDLVAQGPINRPKDAIYPLTGVVETDWTSFTFTMNWMLTRPHHPVRFEAGEPYCHLLPIRRADLEAFTPRKRALSSAPELQAEYEAWQASRNKFNAGLVAQDPATVSRGWQKHYYQGKSPTQTEKQDGAHRTKIRLRGFSGA
jgi:hypothetical protein